MPAYKDEKQGTWFALFYYQNWKGERTKKMKRGFPTKREAIAWEHEFLQKAGLSSGRKGKHPFLSGGNRIMD